MFYVEQWMVDMGFKKGVQPWKALDWKVAFQRKSKTYRKTYLDAMKALYSNDKECCDEKDPIGFGLEQQRKD